MRFYLHPEAKEEFDGAVDFYEQSQAALGLEFETGSNVLTFGFIRPSGTIAFDTLNEMPLKIENTRSLRGFNDSSRIEEGARLFDAADLQHEENRIGILT